MNCIGLPAWLLRNGQLRRAVAIVAAGACLGIARGSDNPAASPLRVGLQRAAFANLNESDAASAYRVFVTTMARKRGYELRPELVVYENARALEAAMRAGAVNVAAFGTWQLLELKLDETVDIAFVPTSGGRPTRRLLLLARRTSELERLADCRGKSLLLLRDTRVNLAEPWLETLCLREGLGPWEEFFGPTEIVSRANNGILPVFFGRSDVCVVDDESFEIACELNPQLRAQLEIVAESAPMLDSVICLNRIGWESPRHRRDLAESLAELHQEPSGRQMLTLFRMERLLPFSPSLLESVAHLYAEHSRLKPSEASATASTASP